MAHFYGAPAMALISVGAGGVLVGEKLVGAAAVGVGGALWLIGTALGIATAVAMPRRHRGAGARPFGGWLIPVVPPMVSAATGPLFLSHLPGGAARSALMTVCSVFFLASLAASSVMIARICASLLRHGVGPTAMAPTVWIVLGPLGQSVTAAHAIGGGARGVVFGVYADGVADLGLAYGIVVWLLAIVWVQIALVLTARAARNGLPFTLAWWSFIFPVGTLVTGSSGLAEATGSPVFVDAALGLFCALLVAWAGVAVRTAGGIWTGRLLRAPDPAA